jgi:hypothetical protein
LAVPILIHQPLLTIVSNAGVAGLTPGKIANKRACPWIGILHGRYIIGACNFPGALLRAVENSWANVSILCLGRSCRSNVALVKKASSAWVASVLASKRIVPGITALAASGHVAVLGIAAAEWACRAIGRCNGALEVAVAIYELLVRVCANGRAVEGLGAIGGGRRFNWAIGGQWAYFRKGGPC